MTATKKKTAKKKRVAKGCNCIDKINEQLKPYNQYIERHMVVNFETGQMRLGPPELVCAKIDSKKKAKMRAVFCNHCPVCGKKIPR